MIERLTDRAAVRRAIEEHDQLGRPGFLQKYGYGRARGYVLEYEGKFYDSKAIAGVAYGFQHGTPLSWQQFSGGQDTVQRSLERMRFTVHPRVLTGKAATAELAPILARASEEFRIPLGGQWSPMAGGEKLAGRAAMDLYARFVNDAGDGVTIGVFEAWGRQPVFRIERRRSHSERYDLRTWPIAEREAAEAHLRSILASLPIVNGGARNPPRAGSDWTTRENRETAKAYFAMLRAEILGQASNKTAVYKATAAKLDSRTWKAVERKFRNVSAILEGRGFRRIAGLAPLGNFQNSLADAVSEQIALWDQDPADFEVVAVVVPPDDSFDVDPEPQPTGQTLTPPAPGRRGKKRRIDYAARDAKNADLGTKGEEWALTWERKRLVRAGRADLADKVQHVSAAEGDGVGYDIASFDLGGGELCIEVKATRAGKDTPFFVSATEYATARAHPERYVIYRLFEFGERPRMYLIRDPAHALVLEPCAYVAVCK